MTAFDQTRENPREQGRLNSLRSILATVSDELREQADIIQGIVQFTTEEFPEILQQYTPINLRSTRSELITPYPFTIGDLTQVEPASRPAVFDSVSDLIENLDLNDLRDPLEGAELIGIDESHVDMPLPQSALAYLKTVAFRMYRGNGDETTEAIGPVVSKMKMRLREAETFESENKLRGYTRNLYVAYVSALTALANKRTPFVVLHGPLVRAIGGFTDVEFSRFDAEELLDIDFSHNEDIDFIENKIQKIYEATESPQLNLPLSPGRALDGENNLERFFQFCEHRMYSTEVDVESWRNQDSSIPGFYLYFYVLRSLLDLAREFEFTVIGVVEDISSATELTRLLLPSLVSNESVRREIRNSSLESVLEEIDVELRTDTERPVLFNEVRNIIDRLNLSDSNLFTWGLDEAQYTEPVTVYRYRTRNDFQEAIGDNWLGIPNEHQEALRAFFPPGDLSHPADPEGYRVMMSYLRSTPLREPIRVEYFDLPHYDSPEEVMGPTYLLSFPYQKYGLPLILYYADQAARTPTKLIRTIVEKEYLDLVLQGRLAEPISARQILGRLTRNFFDR